MEDEARELLEMANFLVKISQSSGKYREKFNEKFEERIKNLELQVLNGLISREEYRKLLKDLVKEIKEFSEEYEKKEH